MSTRALAIRDAIFQRVADWPGYVEFKLSPHMTVQPDKLPSLAVYLMGETMRPDGDANVGEPHFMSEISVAISVIRKAGDREVLEGLLDEDATDLETALLTDPTFVHFGGGFNVPAGEVWAVGDSIYWDFTNKRATSVSDGNALTGFVETVYETFPAAHVSHLFEAITQITRRPMFPNQGEMFFAEMRLELAFQVRLSYPPTITDDYHRMRLTTRQFGGDPDAPAITTVIDQAS